MKHLLLIIILLNIATWATAQQETRVSVAGKIYPAIIDECGDTLIVANLQNISVSSPRAFDSEEEWKKYQRYRRAAAVVYPYATEAIKVFRELEAETEDLRRGKRKKYARHLQKDLKDKFEDPLRKLTRTQGFVLTKMIERELGTPTYDLIKDLRGGVTATYWGTLSKFYGYKLKDGYTLGEDRILDMVLDDFNISYTVSKDRK
ncbi:MAG TPA: DUF4294 domain-containing protein [Saprospiraceae bacterium]|nr:DUF4294 domain-containing protein [Saprospiraceae bacterium]HMP23553.1 DUF4294 domain-containing protein [Saprospiraceae bacterium]